MKEDAERAVKEKNGAKLMGRQLAVDLAKSRTPLEQRKTPLDQRKGACEFHTLVNINTAALDRAPSLLVRLRVLRGVFSYFLSSMQGRCARFLPLWYLSWSPSVKFLLKRPPLALRASVVSKCVRMLKRLPVGYTD